MNDHGRVRQASAPARSMLVRSALGRDFLEVEPGVLTELTGTAMRDIAGIVNVACALNRLHVFPILAGI